MLEINRQNYKLISEQEFDHLPYKEGIYILNLYQGKSYYLVRASIEQGLNELEGMLVNNGVMR